MKATRRGLFFVTILALISLPRLASAVEGLVSYWKFDEGSGGTAYDCYNGNHGAIHGAQWTTGILDGALSFDGEDDYLLIPEDASFRDIQNEITLEAWINHESLTNTGPTNIQRYVTIEPEKAVIRNDPTWGTGFHFYVKAGDRLYHLRPSLAPETDTWYHVVGTHESGEMKFHINGELVASRADVRGTLATALGSRAAISTFEETFHGTIDEVAIYDHALTPEEIERHCEDGLDGVDYLAIEVTIDIKPDTDPPNPINPNSHGVIPVAILTTDTFDAADVDWTTVELAGAGVALRGKSIWLAHFEDVDGDGNNDLLVQVETDTGSAWLPGEVDLTGETWAGMPIHGSDTVVLKPE